MRRLLLLLILLSIPLAYYGQGGGYGAYVSVGSVVIKTSVSGDIYIDNKLICPITIGESKSIYDVVSGLRTIELRSPQGKLTQRVNVPSDDIVVANFIVDLTHKGLVYVEGGSFTMGDTSGKYPRDERPHHTVNLSPFYIGKHEVTQQLFKEVMGYNASYFCYPDNPVEMISWYEAIEFCNKLSVREGLQPVYTIDKGKKDSNNYQPDDDLKWTVTYDQFALGYRLPTEAEWEFAARGGIYGRGFLYAGSNNPKSYGWYNAYDGSYVYSTYQVGSFNPNEIGLYDMSGNVYEWCWDWFGDYSAMEQNNPSGARAGSFRIVRGGSFYSDAYRLRLSQRGYDKPNRYYNVIGMRLARSSGGF
ncbi:MAG: SUMF1/EgtB/PvdO family nonheme iron enzyme [Candidatus Cloacimonetes bacterium]|jgi:formylglycine-generating enzyme required for sulfatase activity|nr:SUMF1/EgtB/PvdO family nonheme iron enzyme [Candidatus Cloacimonadota bacterium]HOH79610.1 SUMF1/EgtB/PvdO family nonheme iron enzyme [Candidatus Cloacimonadota bacterium]HPN41421.1 SUMF1/EgtB/PvdO family nonheme iron enzyme [Candidatus Cloacimonadota bacterium]